MKRNMNTQTHLSSIPALRKSFQILAFAWLLAALLLTIPVTMILQGAFPLFTFAMLLLVIWQLVRTRDAAALGLRPISGKDLARYTAFCLAGSLLLMAVVEPWSHTYRTLFVDAVSSSRPDTMFGWLARFPGPAGWAGFTLYAAFVALFAEEVFFRGWLLTWLKGRMSAPKAILWQATLFTLPQLLAAFLLPPVQGGLYAIVYSWLAIGLLNGWAASRTGSIWPGLISAALYNVVMTAFSL